MRYGVYLYLIFIRIIENKVVYLQLKQYLLIKILTIYETDYYRRRNKTN